MLYVLIDKALCDDRRIFQTNSTLPAPDGRVIVSLSELSYLRFSVGQVEVINNTDLSELIIKLNKQAAAKANGEEGGEA